MWVSVSNSWLGAFPLINNLEMHLQKGPVHCICNMVSLQSPMRGGGVFSMVVSDGGVSAKTLGLLQVQVGGPSAGEAVTALMRMLAAAALFGDFYLSGWAICCFIVNTGYPIKGYVICSSL